jgi:hypothetical protein
MRRILLTLAIILSFSVLAIAQAVVFSDDFEAYIAGQQVACQNPTDWTTWSNAPCGTEDAYVSTNYAFSGTKSFVIVMVNDFVKPLNDITTGKWEMRFQMYIPTGKGGYFNTLADFAGAASVWASQVYFNVGGTGDLFAAVSPGPYASFSYPNDTWFTVSTIADLNNDLAELWINGVQVGTPWQYTLGTFGAGCPLKLDGNDFYGPLQTADDEAYFDDYQLIDMIIPVELTSFTANVNDLGQVVLNWETATEVNNQGFEIERRTETSEFRTVGFVEGYGTTTEPRSYIYTDVTAENGINYYRLKQVDFNGTYEYSDEVEVDVNGPLTFDLAQNYPNPFNPSTNIKYSVPEAGNIRLSVYNVVGEEVAVLAEGFSESGFFEVTFDASNLPSGIYISKLQSANSVQSIKMMLLK